ncbi:MAG: hypothetical protein GQ527_08375, partial [Bacteroidales bacterium]|nr:hypothetical protein [Bacteroidales bacterium]
MDRFFYSLWKLILKQKLLFATLLMLFITVLIFTVSKLELSENASRILPKSVNSPQLTEILENISFSDRIFFNIYLADSNDIDAKLLIDFANKLNDKLEENRGDGIESIQLQIPDQSIDQVSDYIFNNLPFLLEESDYQRIDSLIQEDEFQKNFQKKYKSLLSPASLLLKKFILKDPVGISNKPLERLRNFQLDNSITLINNYLFTQDNKHLLFYLIPNQPASETKKNSVLVKQIKQAINELSA